jgi:amino-acid N-acetyltransferase
LAPSVKEKGAFVLIAHVSQGGVRRVHLLDSNIQGALLLELYTRDGIGTMVSSDMYEGTRDATINDVGGIEQLLRPLVELDIVVNRPREQACTLLYIGPSSEHKSLLR